MAKEKEKRKTHGRHQSIINTNSFRMSMEDSQFNEKVKRELEEARNESSHKFAKSIHSNSEDYHLRKTLFFVRILNSMAENRNKIPVLSNLIEINWFRL